jgi:Uma2 family endonuclease
MAVAQRVTRYTADDLLTMPDGKHYELVDGELVEIDMGAKASWIAGELYARLRNFNAEARLGWVLPPETGYQCFSVEANRVRKPDASFIRAGRLPGDELPGGHIPVPPDLAVEVVSPNDFFSEVRQKVRDYLDAGVRLVWIIDPETHTVDVLRANHSVAWLQPEDELSGEDVFPGFSCRVSDLFPPPAAGPSP